MSNIITFKAGNIKTMCVFTSSKTGDKTPSNWRLLTKREVIKFNKWGSELELLHKQLVMLMNNMGDVLYDFDRYIDKLNNILTTKQLNVFANSIINISTFSYGYSCLSKSIKHKTKLHYLRVANVEYEHYLQLESQIYDLKQQIKSLELKVAS